MNINVPIQLDKDSGEPMYIQLYKMFKNMIENGHYTNSEKLPPIRKVSEQLGINNSTVVNAYKLLENNGYAYSRTGSGTYVLSKKTVNEKDINKKFEFSLNITDKSEIKVRNDSINFSSSTPDPALFPIAGFKDVLNEVLDRDGGQAFGYTEIKGYRPLRECISNYMNRFNVECGIESIQIISGAQQGIDIIAKVLIDYGDIIITEKPTYTGAIAVFKSRGAKIIDIPIGTRGIDINELECRLKEIQPKFIYVMTNFQNPTGFSYSQKTMERLLFLAEKYNFYIIEDDYLLELNYKDEKRILLKSLDTSDRVIYIKSFSKIFMPGVRLGFIIVPRRMADRVLAAKHLSDISTSGFMQRVFDLYIRKNMFDDHIGNIKHRYYERYKIITENLDSSIKDVSYYKPEGGIHLWLRLRDTMSSNVLYSQCLLHNIIISPGTAFFIDETDSPYFRLSYVSTEIDTIKKGINELSHIINDLKCYNTKFQNIPFV